MKITHRPVAFSQVQTHVDYPGVYQLCHAFQLDMDGTVGLSLNIRREMPGALDIEIGSDLAIVRDLELRRPVKVMPLARSSVVKNPKNGEPMFALSYPVDIGFVPRGAKLPDGTPHPQAGTGFGTAHVNGLPCYEDGTLKVTGVAERNENKGAAFFQLMQFEYDGKEFKTTSEEFLDFDDILPGWQFVSMGLGVPISDGGDGLFVGLNMRPAGTTMPGRAGISQWKRLDGKWRPVSFVPVAPYGSYESSFVRDKDGSILLTARGCHQYLWPDSPEAMADSVNMNDIRIWRSADNGKTWELICNAKQVRCCATVSIGITPKGQPFVACHPYYTKDNMGRVINEDAHSDWMREKIVLWLLSADRTSLTEQLPFKTPLEEFDPPTYGKTWWIDHPKPALLTLADGREHTIMSCRVLEYEEAMGQKPKTPFTGTYIEEIAD